MYSNLHGQLHSSSVNLTTNETITKINFDEQLISKLIEVYKTYVINKHLTDIKGEVTAMLFFILELNKPNACNFLCLT